ncbi:Pentatricopeptide repeat-containing protein [Quillaja saponaria]|uniref:Pentatricopeptide repeat-containing protein n=1 Tax=Quillaja saponaria TaxID=32244 RepID=A0AAD7QIE0_QUISA|nr:Pentatricopeptide repeat-containing protein [Quillaja saponaria]
MDSMCSRQLRSCLLKLTTTFRYKSLQSLKYSIFRLNCSYSSGQFFQKSRHDSATSEKGSKFIIFCNSQITKNGRNGNIEQAESMFSRMPHKSSISWTAMLTAYADNGQVAKAQKTFDGMPEQTTASYNAMITAYIRNGCNVDEAYKLFAKMHKRNAVSYAAMITGFIRAGMLNKAEKLYSETPVWLRDPVCSNAIINGYLKIERLDKAVQVFEGMIERNAVSWSSMVDGFCKKGRIIDAKNMFDQMPERNVVSWTAIIDGYMEEGCFEDGFGLFMTMRREGVVGVNSTTMTIMCKACGGFGRTREGMQMHGLVLRMGMGYEFDVVLGNSIITMYCKFGCTDEAYKMFCMISKKDVVSWNSLISGYIHNNQVEEAYMLFETMHGKDIISWTAMITGFSMKGDTKKSIELFDMMPEKDDVVWTAVISGFVNNREYEEAFGWYVRMLRRGYKPIPLTLSSVVAASAALGTLNQGMQIHAHALKLDLEYDLSVQNSLISMYSKCGNVGDAYNIFTDINEPNIISYNSIINGFGQNGFSHEALNIYKEMQKEGHLPNHITFLAVLSACTHAGLVEEGWNYFNSMKSLYQIEPGHDHYACMVDLLGRAGLLDEAVDLIYSMPLEPHSGVWGALLAASKTHIRLDLARLAAQRLNGLEPGNATPYVVMSNLYLIAGQKVEGDRIRMAQNLKRIKKSPGCSWIIVKDKIHLFLAGDQSHVNIEGIKATIFVLAKEMHWSNCLRDSSIFSRHWEVQ